MKHVEDVLNQWAGVMALLAFVLVIPLNMLSNILTPVFQGWWAATSRQRKERLVATLLTRIETIEHFSRQDLENLFALAGKRLAFSLTFLMGLVLFGSMYAGKDAGLTTTLIALGTVAVPLKPKIAKLATDFAHVRDLCFVMLMATTTILDIELVLFYRACQRISPFERKKLSDRYQRRLHKLTTVPLNDHARH